MTSQGPEQGLVTKFGRPADLPPLFLSTERTTIQPFTTAEKKAFRKDGHIIYPFSLQTIKTQEEARKPFHFQDNYGSKFKTTSSMVGEVAFIPNPKRFFIPGSNNKTYEQQEELVKLYEKHLQKSLKLPENVRVVMGQAPDYTQLAFIHLEETGERLFGLEYGFNFTRTKTSISTHDVANVGSFYSTIGLHVYGWPIYGGLDKVFVVPLVVSVAPSF